MAKNRETSFHIGDVIVHIGEPPSGNPYAVRSLMGDERVAALIAYRDNTEDAQRYSYWYAPASGGARRLDGPHEVNWETSGLRPEK